MNKLLLTSLIATTTTFSSLFVSTTAQAVSNVSKEQYEQQGINEENLMLDYDTWNMLNNFVNEENNSLDVESLDTVDLSSLSWDNGVSGLEVYFINEGANRPNQLFYSTNTGGTKTEIFNGISSSLSIIGEDDGPLALGQGVSLGDFAGNINLEFFLKPYRANNPDHQTYFGYNAANNEDKISHIIANQVGEYLLLGFEDVWGGGDRDYNDTFIAVKGVDFDESEAVPVPEPGMALSLVALGMLGARVRKGRSE